MHMRDPEFKESLQGFFYTANLPEKENELPKEKVRRPLTQVAQILTVWLQRLRVAIMQYGCRFVLFQLMADVCLAWARLPVV